MKHLLSVLFAGILGIFSPHVTNFGATILFPVGGGTGTSTSPTLGQILVGNSGGTYSVQATSTLGFPGVPVSIANGGTATSSAVTNGVYYYNGTNAEADSLLTFTGGTTNRLGIASSSPGYQFTIQGTGTNQAAYDGVNFGVAALMNSTGLSSNLGSVNLIPGATTGVRFNIIGYSGASIARIQTNSSSLKTLQFDNSGSGNFNAVFGGPGLADSPGGLTSVGINATSTPAALLSVAGSAGGTTPLFMLSTSTAAFATSTVFEVDSLGNQVTPMGSPGLTLYNTADQVTNFEKVNEGWSNNVFTIGVTNGGTGNGRAFAINGTGGGVFTINTAGQGTYARGGTNVGPIFSITGTYTGSGGTQVLLGSTPILNQTLTAGYTALKINPTETALGSGTKLLIQAGTSTAPDLFDIDNTGHVVTSGSKPVLSSCGSTNNISGNDNNGTIIFTGTLVNTCTMTFATPVPTGQTVECEASTNTLAAFADISATSTTAVTFGTSATLASGAIFYDCKRHQ